MTSPGGSRPGGDHPSSAPDTMTVEDPDELVAANEIAWDRAALKYETDVGRDVADLRAGRGSLLDLDRRLLGDLTGVQRAVHLQCSHGQDALSLLGLGVHEVVGVDISRAMLDQARRKSNALGANALWVHGDVLDVPSRFDGSAGLVYTGRGALPWVHDLDRWASVVARLLEPGGRLVVHEGHPIEDVWDSHARTYRLDPGGRGYFDGRARRNETFPASAVSRFTPAGETVPSAWEWFRTLGEVVTAVAGAGLRVEVLEEHPEPFWERFPNMGADELGRLPHSYSLVARRSSV